jgi:hypothetical protein
MGPRGAIETNYNGYRFRSRLEARWAVFFDTLGVRYEYEREGYRLGDGTPYLCDFWLPDHGYWVEVKGETPGDRELRKALGLAQLSVRPVLLFVGTPGEETILAVYGELPPEGVRLAWCPHCERFDFNGRGTHTGFRNDALDYAYRAARSARFEFGETPVGPRLAG